MASGISGIGYGLQDINLSGFSVKDEIERAYRQKNPTSNDDRVRANVTQIVKFVLDIRIGDYVLMPDSNSSWIHHGKVTSDPYHVATNKWANRRDVAWAEGIVYREELPSRLWRGTVTELTGELKDTFLKLAIRRVKPESRLKLPEDSWLRFHRAVSRKLDEDEWWSGNNRQDFEDLIDEIRWADPSEVAEDYRHVRWTPDPYSFYLAFNMRTDGSKRLHAYRMTKDLLDIDAEIPDEGHRVRGLGAHYRFTNPPSDEDIDALWDFYKFAVDFDPSSDVSADESDQYAEVNDEDVDELRC